MENISLALEKQSKHSRLSVLNIVTVLGCRQYFAVTGTLLPPVNAHGYAYKAVKESRDEIKLKNLFFEKNAVSLYLKGRT